jgi:hypothetical protein
MYDWPTKNAAFRHEYVKFPFSILQTEIFQQRTNEPFRPLRHFFREASKRQL